MDDLDERTPRAVLCDGEDYKNASIASDDDDEATGDTADSSPSPPPRLHPALSTESIPDNIMAVKYEVRGKVLDAAFKLELVLDTCPFKKFLRCHIGNPHAVGSPPITYVREVLSLLTCPKLFDEAAIENLSKVYSVDSIKRAQTYRKAFGDPGAYTHSQGCSLVREEVCRFLALRDGHPSPPERVFMTNGASEAIQTLLSCLLRKKEHAIMLPLPQYPLYSATVTKLQGSCVYYELDEENNWGCDIETITESYNEGIKNGLDIRAIVVISPGNPASTLLDASQIHEILCFAERNRLLVIADEVYQENVYAIGHNFVSFRKVLMDTNSKAQLASLHSASKGLFGECGFRGGMMQLENVDAATLSVLYKMRSVDLCSNTFGQTALALIVNPPKPGEDNYNLYYQETQAIKEELVIKAQLVADFFNSLVGVSCQPIRGALYAFPLFAFPCKGIEHAKGLDMSIDLFYCLELLSATGIVCTPGDAFGQREGTHHLRMTILPNVDDLRFAMESFREFHAGFWTRYCI